MKKLKILDKNIVLLANVKEEAGVGYQDITEHLDGIVKSINEIQEEVEGYKRLLQDLSKRVEKLENRHQNLSNRVNQSMQEPIYAENIDMTPLDVPRPEINSNAL
jgi:archaellum component FlaC